MIDVSATGRAIPAMARNANLATIMRTILTAAEPPRHAPTLPSHWA